MWTGYDLSRGVFVIFANSKRGRVSLTCCSVLLGGAVYTSISSTKSIDYRATG